MKNKGRGQKAEGRGVEGVYSDDFAYSGEAVVKFSQHNL